MQNPKIQIQLKDGNVVIETLPQIAPKHVKRICELVKSGFYDGLKFHRVVKDFMMEQGAQVFLFLLNFPKKTLRVAQ